MNSATAALVSTTVATVAAGDILLSIVASSNGAETFTYTNNTGQAWTNLSTFADSTAGMSYVVGGTFLGATPSGVCACTGSSSASKKTQHVLRFLGGANVVADDGHNYASSGVSSVTVEPTSNISTVNADDIVIGFSYRTASATQAWTAPGGLWNLGVSSTAGSLSNVLIWSGYQIRTTTGTLNFPGATTANGTILQSVIQAVKGLQSASPAHNLSALGVGT